MKIGIVGSRRRDSEEDWNLLVDKLSELDTTHQLRYPYVFVSGGCPKGADSFAEIIARKLGIHIIIHYPDRGSLPEKPMRWDFAKINYDRNTLIARDSDILIALVAPDRKGGTEHCIKQYLKLGKTKLFLI